MKQFILVLSIFCITLFVVPQARAQDPMRVVALGDSLTAGFGLSKGEDFATKLEAALLAKGLNVKIQNAGLSGDTTEGGKNRLAQVIDGDPKPRLVLIALGANDMLRRIDPATTRQNLSHILQMLQDKKIPALLIGMRSPMGFGPFMGGPYADIYKDLSKEFDVPLIPFLLEGVAMNKNLNQPDGLHPNEKGVAIMVKNIAPDVEEALED